MKSIAIATFSAAALIGASCALIAQEQQTPPKKSCSSGGGCPSADKGCSVEKPKALTEEKKLVAQTKCPVQGGDIDKALFVDVDGKRIYVCCSGCIDVVKKNPQKYIKELEDKGITLEKAK